MSPTPFNNTLNVKKEPPSMCPSPLKVHKDSHFIKKSSPSSSSSSSINGVIKGPQQRQPVIIYTHSPKIIHTHPRNFMALVQKLTGLSKSEEDQLVEKTPKIEPGINDSDNMNPHATQRQHAHQHINNYDKNPNKGIMNDDNESTSVITDENGSNSLGDGQVNSCPAPPIFDHAPNPCFNNIPFFTPNSYDLLCSTTQPYYNYPDSMFYFPPMRNSISSSTLEGLKEFPEF